jgi:proteasome alpha subunit
MQNNNQQAYDRGITIFSPDGRLYQVEYAREAVKRGAPSVGVRTADGVVLAAAKRTRSRLMEADSLEKIHKIDDHIGVATAGHVADGRRLVDMARQRAQVERLRYGQPIDVETLTKAITDQIQEFTQTGGARPFGVALLVAGVDTEDTDTDDPETRRPALFETDPSGTPVEWAATAIGSDRDDLQRFLEDEYTEGSDLETGIDLALRALADIDDDFDPEEVAIATVDTESASFRELTGEEVAARAAELDLDTEDTEE